MKSEPNAFMKKELMFTQHGDYIERLMRVDQNKTLNKRPIRARVEPGAKSYPKVVNSHHIETLSKHLLIVISLIAQKQVRLKYEPLLNEGKLNASELFQY